MNRDAMPRRSSALAPLLLVAACQGQPDGSPGPSPNGVDLRGSSLGGEFDLVDKTGKSVRWSDFGGRYRIVYFGYTWCPDVCPTDVQRMAQGLKIFSREHPELAKSVQPIFITVDPERDTPAKVGEFAAAFSPQLIGLTGSPALTRYFLLPDSTTAYITTLNEKGPNRTT